MKKLLTSIAIASLISASVCAAEKTETSQPAAPAAEKPAQPAAAPAETAKTEKAPAPAIKSEAPVDDSNYTVRVTSNGMDFDLFCARAVVFNGLQGCVLGPAMATEMNGFQTSLPVCIARDMNGFQMSLVNVARKELNGFQLGVVNFSRSNGCQVGVVNIIRDGWLPFTIGVNFSY